MEVKFLFENTCFLTFVLSRLPPFLTRFCTMALKLQQIRMLESRYIFDGITFNFEPGAPYISH